MTDSLLNRLLEPNVFSAFVEENMKSSTYVAYYRDELGDPEYEPSKSYKAVLGEYAAAFAGSIIEKNADKPRFETPSAEELTGSISRIADEFQMDNDRLDHYLYLEDRYRRRFGSLDIHADNPQSVSEYRKMVQYLFNPYETAVIAPHKRIDLLYFEGLFKGTMTISKQNNSKGGVIFTADLGVKQLGTKAGIWSNSDTAKPLDDLLNGCEVAEAMGKAVQRIRMSRATFNTMLATKQMAGIFRIDISAGAVNGAPTVGVAAVNQYLDTLGIPPIEVEKPKTILLANGNSTNAVPNDRVVFMMAPRVAVLKVADSTEMADPLPNKVYANHNDNLVGTWRDAKGRFIDYEMWAFPVFTGRKNYLILKTDTPSA